MTVSKRDFEAIACILHDAKPDPGHPYHPDPTWDDRHESWCDLVDQFAIYFSEQNEHFNPDKFRLTCETG